MLDIYRPEHFIDDITDAPIDEWQEDGVDTILSDIEGTIVPYGTPEVDPEITEFLSGLASRDMSLILVTNKRSGDLASSVANQVGAEQWYSPRRDEERKPSPLMINRALEADGIRPARSPDQLAMIGDKLTADIAAANRAGVKHTALVKKHGKGDHIGDAIFRRPYEAGLRAILKVTASRTD